MIVWFVNIAEPLPSTDDAKRFRNGLLAEKLIEQRHDVVWWTSAFDHFTKNWRYEQDTRVKLANNVEIQAIKGRGYKKNISLARFRENRLLARRFAELAEKETLPDVVLASSPPHDVACAAVKFCNKHKIPVLVDIRDEWPQHFVNLAPTGLKWLARLLLWKEFRIFKKAMRNATGITSMMGSMLDWGLKFAERERNEFDKVFYLGSPKCQKIDKMPEKLGFLKNIEEKFIAVFIGSFVVNTAPGFIVECARQLKDSDVHFVMAGDGELAEALKKQADGLENVTFTGWLNEQELTYLLENSHVGLSPVPKKRVAFGNKMFAYFAAGLPVIASLDGEFKQLAAEHNIGFFVPPNDLAEYVKKIRLLHDDSKIYDEMSANVREIFAKKFDSDNIYKDFASHVESVGSNSKIA